MTTTSIPCRSRVKGAWRRLRAVPWLLLPVIAGCGAIGLVPGGGNDPAELTCIAACTPTASPWLGAPRSVSSVDIVAYGVRWASESFRAVAAGVPDSVNSNGRVYFLSADKADGSLGGTIQALLPPVIGRQRFGAAILAANIRGASTNGRGANRVSKGWGEELLVGAPATNNNVGAVHWYFPRIDGNDIGATHEFRYGGTVSGYRRQDGGEFGASLATSHTLSIESKDWIRTQRAKWIAIGAPGIDKVYVFNVDFSQPANPLVWVGELGGPRASSFGLALAVADLNQDGYDDLAVGAPHD